MPATTLPIEDLILSSRSLTLEEKQDLLKRLDMLTPSDHEKLQAILNEEYQSFRRLDALELQAIEAFTHSLKTVTVNLASALL